MRKRTAKSLFVGGPNDFAWNGHVARELGETLEIDGDDHGLARTSDAPQIAAGVSAFSAGLGDRA